METNFHLTWGVGEEKKSGKRIKDILGIARCLPTLPRLPEKSGVFCFFAPKAYQYNILTTVWM